MHDVRCSQPFGCLLHHAGDGVRVSQVGDQAERLAADLCTQFAHLLGAPGH